MAENEIQVKQLTDASTAKMIAGYTPEHAIYDTSGERLDTKLAGLDYRLITAAQATALAAINDASTSAVTAVKNEQNRIAELFDVIFPMKVNMAIVPNSGMTACEITSMVTERGGAEFTVDTIKMMKGVHGGSLSQINARVSGSRLSGTSEIAGSVETYQISAMKQNRTTATETITKYICAYGASSMATMNDSLFSDLKKVQATGLKAMPSVTTASGQYIWIVVPQELSITRVMCSGFDVPMTQLSNYVSSDTHWNGTYHVYRSVYALGDATWQLMIN